MAVVGQIWRGPWEEQTVSEKPFEPSLPTSARPTEQSTADAQKFLASIVEHAEDAIVGFTPDGIIVSWNRGAEKLFSYAAQEIIGQNIVALSPDEAASSLKAAIQSIRRGEAVIPFDGTGVSKDRRRIEFAASVSPVNDVGWKIDRCCGNFKGHQ